MAVPISPSVDDVLITPQLAQRPIRAPDYAAENRALAALAQEMAVHPDAVLQRLAEIVLETCRADSAGISMLEPGDENGLFRWRATAGAFAAHLGGTMPREASPCGAVLARDSVLLFERAERFFPALRGVEPRIHETLLAPWHEKGEAIGALWAIKHTPDGRFDAEHARVLTSVARFAAAAHQMTSALGEAKQGLEELGRHVEERTKELIRANERLRASEEQFGRAMSIGTVGALFFGLDGHMSDANQAFERMSGYGREELLTVDWHILTSSEFMADTERAARELTVRGETAPYEKELVRKDGSRWWALCAPTRLTRMGRDCVEFIIDVTERKWAEAALRESERRFRTLAEGIPQLVFRSRGSGERSWPSPQWIAYTGLSEEESRGLGWLEAVHPDDRAATIAAWTEAQATGIFFVEHRLRFKEDGACRWFQTRAAPLRGDPETDQRAGSEGEWLGASADIDDQVRAREVLARSRAELEALVAERTAELERTLNSLRAETAERGRVEEALRQAQKMEAVGQLTGGIAHDFNNMLQGMSGGLEIARRRVVDGRPGEALRYMDAAREAVSRAAALTRRLLAFARRQRLDPKPVDADGLIAGLADLVRRTVGPGITVELRLGGGTGQVMCDANELESALLNLCINARDAMPEGGRLTIGTRNAKLSASDVAGQDSSRGPYVAISVTDTGQGMPQNVLVRVFEPFFTTKPQGQGTGLGLSQVYGFVRQSGGIVRLQSIPGRGTTVNVFLPRHEPTEAAEEPAPLQIRRWGGVGQTVLLVDDEEAVRRPAAERLRELGYRVLEAADGPAAMRLVADGTRIDLLITDVGLPKGMNGRQVTEAVRERVPGLPVLFITGFASTRLPPGSEVIGKPFQLELLARRVQDILGRGGPSPPAAPL